MRIYLINQSFEELEAIADKEKFMIEYIFIKGKLKEEELEAQWTEAKNSKTKQKHTVKISVLNEN